MKKINKVARVIFGVVILFVLIFAAWSLWRLYAQSQAVDPQTLESLLPSLNISAVKKAAALLRG